MTRFAHVGALVAGLCVLYANPLLSMVNQWNVSPMYSYAFTVPLISGFLLWTRRQEFDRQPLRPAPIAGGLVLLGALGALALGHLAALQIVEQLSFLVALSSIVLFLAGGGGLRLAAPSLLYLLFMVPFWDAFTETLHTPFQNQSAQIGVTLMRAVGVPAHRDGTIIALPNVTLEVARACSGVNYLIAVLALAVPLSMLRLKTWGRRAVLIASAIVIAALGNGLRVALIGVLAYLEIGSPLHGPFHVLHGLFVAGVGYLVLFAGLRFLEVPSTGSADLDVTATTTRPDRRLTHAWGLAVLVWLLAFVGVAPESTPVALAMPLERLPTVLGRWSADILYTSPRESADMWVGATEHLRRGYFRPGGKTASMDIWYFESQNQNREIVDFKSTDLHRGAMPRQIALGNTKSLTVNVVRWPDEVGLFWYELSGVAERDPHVAKLLSLWTAATSGRSDGAALMLRAPMRAGEDPLGDLEELAAEVHLAFAKHWRIEASPTVSAGTLGVNH